MNNIVILIGRLTHDIELRYTKNNNPVADFSLAVERDKETADFVKVQVWNKTAENLANYTSKGDMIGVKGSLKYESYEDKDGNKRSKTYVVAQNIMFLNTKRKEEIANYEPQENELFENSEHIERNFELPW